MPYVTPSGYIPLYFPRQQTTGSGNIEEERKGDALTDRNEQAAVVRAHRKHRRTLETAASSSWRDISKRIGSSGFKDMARRRALTPEAMSATREGYEENGGEDLRDVWDDTQAQGAKPVKSSVRGLGIAHDWQAFDESIPEWSSARSVEWVETMTSTQQRAFDQVFANADELTDRETEFLLKQSTGLTPRQVRGLFNARASILKDDPETSRTKLEGSLKRTANAHRRTRRDRLARFEVTESFNRGAVAAGIDIDSTGELEAPVYKVWRTQPDERTCPICAPLEGVRERVSIDLAAPTLDPARAHPPAHPGCRCVIVLEVG